MVRLHRDPHLEHVHHLVTQGGEELVQVAPEGHGDTVFQKVGGAEYALGRYERQDVGLAEVDV